MIDYTGHVYWFYIYVERHVSLVLYFYFRSNSCVNFVYFFSIVLIFSTKNIVHNLLVSGATQIM